uniref:Reelin domain-containing protein n=1 Tax=Stomoxys calcitrans TaxID=35570 RepID=A0A1I8PB83_STOCA
MLRFLVIACCLAAPAFGYSTGAPREICSNGLTPEHHVPEQTSPVPYFFSGDDLVKGGEKITIKMGGDDFLGFAVQVHDANKKPIGTFKVVEPNKSQTLACSNADVSTARNNFEKICKEHFYRNFLKKFKCAYNNQWLSRSRGEETLISLDAPIS